MIRAIFLHRAIYFGALLSLGISGCGGETPGSGQAQALAPADTLPLAERREIPGHIAFVSERDGNLEVYLVRPSGEETRLTTTPAAEYVAAPAPDGSGVLVVSVTEDSTLHLEQLQLHPLDGGVPRPIGPRTGRSRSPSWSPDGAWLVFESDEASFRDLYRIDRDGGGTRRLTENPQGNFEPAVSPDGGRIAFASSRDGDAEIYVMRADGRDPRRLTAFHRDDWGAQWSPDGSTLLFLSNREGQDRIFLMRPDGREQRRLTPADTGAARTDLQEADPVWSPDGGYIAYTLRRRDGSARIHVADVRSGETRALSMEGGKDMMPAWSPDGRYLVFTSERAGETDLYLVRADGTAPTRVTRSPGADWKPLWVPGAGAPARER